MPSVNINLSKEKIQEILDTLNAGNLYIKKGDEYKRIEKGATYGFKSSIAVSKDLDRILSDSQKMFILSLGCERGKKIAIGNLFASRNLSDDEVVYIVNRGYSAADINRFCEYSRDINIMEYIDIIDPMMTHVMIYYILSSAKYGMSKEDIVKYMKLHLSGNDINKISMLGKIAPDGYADLYLKYIGNKNKKDLIYWASKYKFYLDIDRLEYFINLDRVSYYDKKRLIRYEKMNGQVSEDIIQACKGSKNTNMDKILGY